MIKMYIFVNIIVYCFYCFDFVFKVGVSYF